MTLQYFILSTIVILVFAAAYFLSVIPITLNRWQWAWAVVTLLWVVLILVGLLFVEAVAASDIVGIFFSAVIPPVALYLIGWLIAQVIRFFRWFTGDL